MTMITPSYLGETIEYSSLHACRSTLEDPTAGKQCNVPSDCASASCHMGVCAGSGCTDGVKNGTETDVDCGGSCPPCAPGKHCGAAADCASLVCSMGACLAATCMDGVKNGAETDVDCGGGTCPKCADKLHCATNGDCTNGDCFGPSPGTCVSCMDGVKDGTESDVDCGGTCPGCALGKPCTAGSDCNQAACQGGVCTTAQSCNELHQGNPALPDGVYTVDFDGPGGMAPLPVYCDMTTSGGGWTALLNPVMMGLAAGVPMIQTQTTELSGSQTCTSPPPVQPSQFNGWNGLKAYACGNITFKLTLTWANPIKATDVLVLAVAQGDTTHALVVNGNALGPDAHDAGSNCFAWDANMSAPSAGTSCWQGALAAPPHAYTGKISGALLLELSTGPAGMGPNNMTSGAYGTGVSLQQILVR